MRFHDLRHIFASILLQNGESPVYVKDQLGHSSIAITVDLYGHLIPGGNTQAVDRLDTPPVSRHLAPDSATSAQPVTLAQSSASPNQTIYPVSSKKTCQQTRPQINHLRAIAAIDFGTEF